MPILTIFLRIMKAKVLFILFISLLATSGYSKISTEENPIDVSLTLFIVNKDKQTNNYPKNPELSVSILDHTLYFSNVDEDFTLTIYDGNGIPVFMDSISSTTIQVNLPGTLTGNYELRLDTDDYYYVGDIVL